MTALVEQLVELTRFRDRDVLDVSLVTSLRELLRPQAVSIYRCVGEGADQRWLTRARLAAGQLAPYADSAWTTHDALPPLAAVPMRHRCHTLQQALFEAGPPALAWFPLATDREPIGVLEIEREQPLDKEEQRLVHGVARIYRNFLALLDYSERDTLTGLFNRKTFDDAFMKTSAGRPAVRGSLAASGDAAALAAQVASAPLAAECWLGVIDIDHFKRVNDSFGHLIGDEVLLLLARLMRASFRSNDRLYRFGGEEFVVLVHCATGRDAATAFERLRANVENYPFPQVGRITVSVGFTQIRAGDSPAAAFERADKAVYHAKDNGRNCIVNHAALVASGLADEGAKTGDVELF
jgi:diguanylate cyclase (GGDEF)-like protein